MLFILKKIKDKLTVTLLCNFQNFVVSHLKNYELAVSGFIGSIKFQNNLIS